MRNRAHRAAARAFALAALLVAGAAHAEGTPAQEADKHFRRAVGLYDETNYAGALVEFQRAYEIQSSYQVLYNIARSHFELQDYASALLAFKRYLEDGGKKIASRRRKDVEKEIEKLEKRVAKLTISITEPGAAVTIDDAKVGTSPLPAPVLVTAGRRKVTATVAERPPVTELVTVVGGEDQALTLTIPVLPKPRVEVVTKRAPSMVLPLVAWVGTGLVTTAAVTTGVLALGASSDLKAALGAFPASAGAIDAAHGKAGRLAAASDVLTGFAIAGAGVSVFLTVRQLRAEPEAEAPTPPMVTAHPFVFPGGVGMFGSF
jgi:hypothetical protein